MRVDSDERGFLLLLDDDEVCHRQRFVRISDPKRLYYEVMVKIGRWMDERDEAKAEYDRNIAAGRVLSKDEEGRTIWTEWDAARDV